MASLLQRGVASSDITDAVRDPQKAAGLAALETYTAELPGEVITKY